MSAETKAVEAIAEATEMAMPFVEAAAGHKAYAKSLGISERSAEQMAVQFHGMLMSHLVKK